MLGFFSFRLCFLCFYLCEFLPSFLSLHFLCFFAVVFFWAYRTILCFTMVSFSIRIRWFSHSSYFLMFILSIRLFGLQRGYVMESIMEQLHRYMTHKTISRFLFNFCVISWNHFVYITYCHDQLGRDWISPFITMVSLSLLTNLC